MGDRRSFRIESKRFDLVFGKVGRNQFRVSERSTYHRSMIYMSKEGARWLGRCVEENVVREGEKAFVRTLREHDKTFVCRRYSNKYGRYIEVLECGRGGSREWIVIPEGYKLNGWKGFSMELNLLLKPPPLNHQVPPQKTHLLASGERTWEKGVVVGGSSKSYKEVVMDRKHEREVRLEPEKPVTNQVQSDGLMKNPVKEHVDTAVSGYGGSGAKVDQTKKGINFQPQITAIIKPRRPLRFSPDFSPANSRNLGKGIVIQLNEKGQRSVFWKSKEKEQQWVPRRFIKSKTELDGLQNNRGKPVEVGLVGECLGHGSRPTYEVEMFCDTEDFGLGSVFEVGSSSGYKECGPHGLDLDGSLMMDSDGSQLMDSGHPLSEDRATTGENSLEFLGTAASLQSTVMKIRSTASHLVEWVEADGGCRWSRWGLAGVNGYLEFLGTAASLQSTASPLVEWVEADGGCRRSRWGLAGVNGSQIMDLGHPLSEDGATKGENSLECLGTVASLQSMALKIRSTASPLVEWVEADGGCRRLRWGLAGANFKVRLFTIPLPIPIPFFSSFLLERDGIEDWLVGLDGGAVIGCGAWVESGMGTGLGGEVVCGGQNIGMGLGIDEGGCGGALTRIDIEGQYWEGGGASPQSPQRVDAWATVDHSGEEILEVSPLCMVSGLLEVGKNTTMDPSEWVMDRIKKFTKFMKVDITDHEEEAMCLFMKIEARWRAKGGPSEVSKKPTRSVKKGMRELKNLASSVNYDSRKSGEGRSGVAERALSVVQ